MPDQNKNLRMLLKFDVGADGFLKMIAVLTIGAMVVLISGIYFLNIITKEMEKMP